MRHVKPTKNLTQLLMVTMMEHEIVTHSVNYNYISSVYFVRQLIIKV